MTTKKKRYYVCYTGTDKNENGEPKTYKQALTELKRYLSKLTRENKPFHDQEDCQFVEDEPEAGNFDSSYRSFDTSYLTVADNEFFQDARIFPVNDAEPGSAEYIIAELRRMAILIDEEAILYSYRLAENGVYDLTYHVWELTNQLETLLKKPATDGLEFLKTAPYGTGFKFTSCPGARDSRSYFVMLTGRTENKEKFSFTSEFGTQMSCDAKLYGVTWAVERV